MPHKAPSKSFSLRTKVLLLLASLFIIFIGISSIKAFDKFAKIKAAKLIEFQSASNWIESEQQRHISQARLVAFMAMNQLRKGLDENICRDGFIGAPGLDSEMGQFAIADLDGKVSCNSIPWLTSSNVANQNFFKKSLELVDFGYIGHAERSDSNKYVAIMARAMRDNSHVQKVILVAMDFSWVKEEINALNLPNEAHFLLLDNTNRVIASSKNLSDWIGKNVLDTPVHERLKAAKEMATVGSILGGARDSLIVEHLFNTGSGEIRILIDIPTDVLLRPAYKSFITELLISIVVFGLIVILVYFWSEKYLLRKIGFIEQAAGKLAAGDLTHRINQGAGLGVGAGDELNHLAESFDQMAYALQVKESAIKEAHEELYRVNRALRVLSAGNRSLLFATSESELLATICRDIVEKGDYLAAWVGFSGSVHDKYMRMAASHINLDHEAAQGFWDDLGNGVDPVISSVREDKVLLVNDTGHESVHPHLSEHANKVGYRSIIILPLHFEGKPFGALVLGAKAENEFSGIQVEYLKETASDTSFGIEMLRTKGENSRLALLGSHHEVMMRRSLEDALRAIAMTIEMRDPYTAGHQRRVADLAKAIATGLGLSDDETHGIYLAAVVHDIGKINVPAEILVKPGKLNDLEFALVKQHVVSSYEILKNVRFPWPIADTVHQHHERLDGTGYPLGLKDGEILFGARIMAVADVVEAMSSHRPYRAGLGIDVALQEIEKGRSTIYDAAVVDACVKLFREERFTLES